MTTKCDAYAKLTTRSDNFFNRTAIVMQKDKITSLDILCDDGTLFCRINLTEFDTDNRGCVDVIVSDNQTARMTAYANGQRTQHPVVEGSKVHAIAIGKK